MPCVVLWIGVDGTARKASWKSPTSSPQKCTSADHERQFFSWLLLLQWYSKGEIVPTIGRSHAAILLYRWPIPLKQVGHCTLHSWNVQAVLGIVPSRAQCSNPTWSCKDIYNWGKISLIKRKLYGNGEHTLLPYRAVTTLASSPTCFSCLVRSSPKLKANQGHSL